MDQKRMKQISDWTKRIDKSKLDIQDALLIASATAEMLEKLEPIYEKYTGQGKGARQ